MIIELLLLLITLTIAYSLLINRIRGLPPGPPPLPLLGNALSFGEPIDEVMLRWSKKYGPVFTVWMPRPTVVIADHKTLQESIVKQGDLFGNRALNHNQMEMLVGGDYGLVFGGNEMWKEQRRFALHSLRDLGYLSSTLQEQAKTYAQQIVANWKEKGANGVDVTENVMFGVGNIIWQLVFGRILPFGDPKFKLASERTHKFFVDVFHPCVTFLEIFPQIAYFDPLFGYPIRRLKNTSDTNMGIIKKELDITEKSVNYDDEPRCYADAFLIEMKRREEKGEEMGNFNRQQLVLASLDMWSAGFETTVTTLRVAIHFLMSHPDVQRKMQKEIDEKIGQRQISLDDHKQLPYCMAAIQEVQRCGNIVELNFFRKTEQETVIGDYFCPERHLNEAGEFVKDSRITPFSLGKRACLGEGLSRMEIFIYLTTFVQHCNFSSPTLIPSPPKTVRGLSRSIEPYKVKITARL